MGPVVAGSFTKSVRSFKADIDISSPAATKPHSTCAVGHALAVAYAPTLPTFPPPHQAGTGRRARPGQARTRHRPPARRKGLFVVPTLVGMSTGKPRRRPRTPCSRRTCCAPSHFRGIDTDRARIVWAHPGLMREIVPTVARRS